MKFVRDIRKMDAVAIESDILEKWLQYEVLLDDAKILLWN
ncbi:hypothetical protein Si044o_00767 [Streptococcus infantarius subsp. infantarius]|nr:hypothetical protein [Streptococcus infantarius subsp. infantarius]